jgi:hypothetical protein
LIDLPLNRQRFTAFNESYFVLAREREVEKQERIAEGIRDTEAKALELERVKLEKTAEVEAKALERERVKLEKTAVAEAKALERRKARENRCSRRQNAR